MSDKIQRDFKKQNPQSNVTRDLAARIAHARGEATESDPLRRSTNQSGGLAKGLRFTTEFISGVVVGALLGWFFDRLLGTSPWIMVVMTIVGFAAGVLNMIRAAEELRKNEQDQDYNGDDTSQV